MSVSSVGNSVLVDEILNINMYVGIFKHNCRSNVKEIGLNHDYFFMHNNDAYSLKSPNINPIKHLRGILHIIKKKYDFYHLQQR